MGTLQATSGAVPVGPALVGGVVALTLALLTHWDEP